MTRADVPDFEPISENSYGIITIRLIPRSANTTAKLSTTNTQVLLIQQKTLFSSHPPFWSFPQRHVEPGDKSHIHTAIREVKEETGLFVKEEGILFKNAEVLSERYRNMQKGWVKEVRYWVGFVEGQG